MIDAESGSATTLSPSYTVQDPGAGKLIKKLGIVPLEKLAGGRTVVVRIKYAQLAAGMWAHALGSTLPMQFRWEIWLPIRMGLGNDNLPLKAVCDT